MNVLEDRRPGPDDYDLAAKQARREAPQQDPGAGNRPDPPRRADVVDRQGPTLKARRRIARRSVSFGGDHREAAKAIVGVGEATDRTIGSTVSRALVARVPGFMQTFRPSEYLGVAVRPHFSGRQDRPSVRPADRIEQRQIVVFVSGVAEFHVHGDRLRAGEAQPIHHARVVAMGNGNSECRCRRVSCWKVASTPSRPARCWKAPVGYRE